MAERSLLLAIVMVVVVLALCGAIYYVVATMDYSGSNPTGSITRMTVEDILSNEYLLTVGALSRSVKLSDITLGVQNQMTTGTIDRYIGPDHAWSSSQFSFYFVDDDNSSSLTNGDGLRISINGVRDWEEVETNLVYVPTGATLVNAVFLASSPFDPELIMCYDFGLGNFHDQAGRQPDAVPNPGWPAPYFTTVSGLEILNISNDPHSTGRFLTVPYEGSVIPSSRMLVQVMVNMTSDPNIASSDTTFVGKGSSWAFRLGSTDPVRGYDYRFSISLGSQWYDLDSRSKVVAGTWRCIAASYDTSTGHISLYIDGLREAALVVRGHLPIDPSLQPLSIGSNPMYGVWEGLIAYVIMSGE